MRQMRKSTSLVLAEYDLLRMPVMVIVALLAALIASKLRHGG
jgi:hypothetical protein